MATHRPTLTRVGESALWVDATPGEADAAAALAGDALDLRVAADGNPAWTAAGFVPLAGAAGGQLVRPLPQRTLGVEGTQQLGRRLARQLRPGDLVVLSGPLGAGKTALTQGIGAGLGVAGRVTSPTFVLARVHAGATPLVHVDAYRLRDAGAPRLELDDLDLDASLPDSVTVVEWGEGIAEGLAADRLDVVMSRPDADQPDLRMVTVRPVGARWATP